MTDHATDIAAGAGILQFLYLPALNEWLQTIFLAVSIIWVVTQLYFKLIKRDK